MPHSYPLAEDLSALRGYPIRRTHYGDYTLYFRVLEDRARVEVLAFRHSRRQIPDRETD
ncbi:hypothetical protein Pan265_20110 [Mucisphaera calidilacus]|uniref:Type II toxin-antitoxin system RelE/ParE family toxin n=2 Tax=Mucisphaera calidilacus TaxID=2527982 RepID=A0A518BYV2_9BACT|nr:hypothetical protein Pan265_20110 [Mucisphaera calidilacus]